MGTSRTTKAQWYIVATNKLCKGPSDPLASSPGLGPHLPTMSMLGGRGIRLERERDV